MGTRDEEQITAPFPVSVASATATAQTKLSAFDACLLRIGIANCNLIYLSSVIPPNSPVMRVSGRLSSFSWGDRLYCVMAERRTEIEGEEAWAGLGWAFDQEREGGLFAESMGSSREAVYDHLHGTLDEMTKRRGGSWDPFETEVTGIRCEGEPVCALVVAAYRSVPWTAVAGPQTEG